MFEISEWSGQHHSGLSSTSQKRGNPAPQRRMDAWHPDVWASALAIARWEDDGGRPERTVLPDAGARAVTNPDLTT